MLVETASRQHEDGDVASGGLLFQPSTDFHPSEVGHHDIAYDEVRYILAGQAYALFAAVGLKDCIVVLEESADKEADIGGVVDHEDTWFGFIDFTRIGILDGGEFGHRGREGIGLGDGVARSWGRGLYMRFRDGDSECRAGTGSGFDTHIAAMKIGECLDEGEADAGATGLDLVGLIEAFENMAEGLRVHSASGVADFQDERASGEGDMRADDSIIGGELEGIAHEIEEDTLQFLLIKGGGGAGELAELQTETDMAFMSEMREGLGPLLETQPYIHLDGAEIEFAILIFTEIKNLIYETAENAHILIGEAYEELLIGGEIGGMGQAAYGLGDEGEGGAEVVADISKEYEFRLSSLVEPLIEIGERIALLHQLRVLSGEHLLAASARPIGPEEGEDDDGQKNDDGDDGEEEGALLGMAGGIEVDLTVEIIDLILLIGYGAIDFQQHIGILAHDGLSRGDDEFIFERFTPGSLDTEVDEFLSGSGINECRIDGAIGHGLHSERGDGIDSGNNDIGAGDLESGLTRADCHAVIMGEDGVDFRMKGENGIYEGFGTGLIPIPFEGGHASG